MREPGNHSNATGFHGAAAQPRQEDIVPSGSISRALHTVGEVSILTAQAFVGLVMPPYRMGSWMKQMEQIGVRSLLVAGITATFTGMVLALQTAYSLPTLGVKFYVGTLVSKSVVRELGPVLTGLIVGGRIGAGMTAEIGTMKVTEQIDALRSMAADPVKELVVPKLAATLVMLPVLTIIGNLLGILGGLLVAVSQLNITASFYLNQVFDNLLLSDVSSGIGKSFFFAYFIAIIGCYNGLHAQGGADGVGRATTNTVVYASILILISDFFLTKLFYILF
jgi:phospholipid/cholesterol/gamma-HCH transport system permease protein